MRLLALLSVFAAAASSALAGPGMIHEARFVEPTERYQHGVFGETSEWGALELIVDRCADCAAIQMQTIVFRLPQTHVFEDIAPRLVDLTGDGRPEVVVVETDISQGARLAIYDETGLVTATPYIGRTRRWLAPAGFGDYNGDGDMDLAYVETPHLGKVLRMFTFRSTPVPNLVEIGRVEGFTNHRIGDPNIWGGTRVCADGAVVIGASPDWSRMLLGQFVNGRLQTADAGPLDSPAQLDAALDCSYDNAR